MDKGFWALVVGIIVVIGGLIAYAAYRHSGVTVNTGDDCAPPPAFTQVSAAGIGSATMAVAGLDNDGAVWVKVNDGCWEQQ